MGFRAENKPDMPKRVPGAFILGSWQRLGNEVLWAFMVFMLMILKENLIYAI